VAKNFSSQVSDGMDVFDVNEERIGTVHEVYDASGAEKSTSGGGYLHYPPAFWGWAPSTIFPSARSAMYVTGAFT
jgi:hypothetical protein